MPQIPIITVPIGASNLHQAFNWLITQINAIDLGDPPAPFALTDATAPLPPAASEQPARQTREPPSPRK
jgi:hypothetical protein